MSARVNIIGAGLAGLSAALTLSRAGVPSRLVSMQQSERAQSVLAEGGINASLNIMGEDDTCAEHFDDTMKGAVWLSDPNAVWGLANGAPEVVRDFISLGVPFQTEKGRMIQRNFGGQKKKRTAYAKSSTGKVLVTALIDAVRKYEVVTSARYGRTGCGPTDGGVDEPLVIRMPRHEFIELDVRDGRVRGVWVRDVYTDELTYLDGPVISCHGGMGGMFGSLTTGTTQSTGDVAAKLFAQGVEMGNLEMLQYHPTTVGITGKRMLISEAARGEGGRLYIERDGKPWYFMEELFPELGNLMPRDVVSRTEYKVLHDDACGDQVYLDMTGLSRDIWKKRLPDLRDEVKHYLDIDPAVTPIPVEPGIHYCMGGVYVDEGHRANIAGLYVAGEAACQYHGANRLGGNSLLGACYGGRVAARTLMNDYEGDPKTCHPERRAGGDPTICHPERRAEGPESKDLTQAPSAPEFAFGASAFIAGDNAAESAMVGALLHGMGIVRDEATIDEALSILADIDASNVSPRMQNRLQLAQAILLSARSRKESRGAHWRSDYPETLDECKVTTVASCAGGGEVVVEQRVIPKMRDEVTAQIEEARS